MEEMNVTKRSFNVMIEYLYEAVNNELLYMYQVTLLPYKSSNAQFGQHIASYFVPSALCLVYIVL
jgi:hypothetical protein